LKTFFAIQSGGVIIKINNMFNNVTYFVITGDDNIDIKWSF
jgi:hypothetical protein